VIFASLKQIGVVCLQRYKSSLATARGELDYSPKGNTLPGCQAVPSHQIVRCRAREKHLLVVGVLERITQVQINPLKQYKECLNVLHGGWLHP